MKTDNRPVYILTSQEQNPGGITNFYNSFKIYSENKYEYIYRGVKSDERNVVSKLIRLITDYFRFVRAIHKKRGVLLINTVLGSKAFFRDGLYVLLSTGSQKRIAYWLGWDLGFEETLENSYILRKWLSFTFFRCDHMIVLSSDCKKKLRDWGYTKEISVETTMVNDRLLQDASREKDFRFRKRSDATTTPFNLLYLGNISKDKGVRDIIRSFHYMSARDQKKKLSFTIVGKGKELKNLKKYASEHDLSVDFPGYVRGPEKADFFEKADLYIFLSRHEGMPISLLEAMAFGLPVLTTRVGGIPDFFEEGNMGYFLERSDPEYISEKVHYLIERPELMSRIAEYNYQYARKHFYASTVSKRLEKIIYS